jgi:hypothetical protein
MTRKYILANTLTRHFIDFAKIMGFFPKIAFIYRKNCEIDDFLGNHECGYFHKMSYYDYVNNRLDYFGKTFLTDSFVKRVYFFGVLGSYDGFDPIEVDYLTELFFSYLKEKNIIRYIRIDRS